MSKAEEFIKERTRSCSNELDMPDFENGIKRLKEYQSWNSPDQARRAVEIAREEIYEWLLNHNDYITANGNITHFDMEKCVNDLKQVMQD